MEEDVRKLEELISKMIDSLQKQVVEKVPFYIHYLDGS